MIDLAAVGYGNGLIYVGIPRERSYMNQFVDNRDALLSQLADAGVGCGYWQAEGHRVDRNRDQIVEAFLRHEKKPEWLLMLDSDMEHPITAPIRLAQWKKPIVGALYFHRGQSHDPFVFDYVGTKKDKYDRMTNVWVPRRDLVYQFLEENGVPMRDGGFTIDKPSRAPLVECDAIGTGCILIHRSVLETMPAPWFEYRVGGNSEDLMFCKEAKELYNIPVYCDLSTVCGHFALVAMGQAQFRMNYLNRGINLTVYTKGIASRWWSKFTGVPIEEAIQAVEQGKPSMVGEVWRKRFGNKAPTPDEVEAFYRDPEVGKVYAMELLHWNFLGPFNQLRSKLTPIRGKDVLEIGAGIGSVALQLWIQGNNVLASEVNPCLREFIDIRYQESVPEITGQLGNLSVIDDGWIEKTPNESLDHVLCFETFEHLSEMELAKTMEAIWSKLKLGGSLIYTANWGQQDVYPMHFDHAKAFKTLTSVFQKVSEMELRKVVR